jgi:hypothetical protein
MTTRTLSTAFHNGWVTMERMTWTTCPGSPPLDAAAGSRRMQAVTCLTAMQPKHGRLDRNFPAKESLPAPAGWRNGTVTGELQPVDMRLPAYTGPVYTTANRCTSIANSEKHFANLPDLQRTASSRDFRGIVNCFDHSGGRDEWSKSADGLSVRND